MNRFHLFAALAGILGLAFPACSTKKHKSPPVKRPQWQGLRMDMVRSDAEELLKRSGLRVRCAPARNITYLDGKDLYTRWVKKSQAGRVLQCVARRQKGAKPGPDRVLESKLYFLDDKLFRLHVKLLTSDADFEQVLKTRFGSLRQQEINRHVYAGELPSRIRVWTLHRASTRLLWLRGAQRQQLVLFSTTAGQVKALKAVATPKKGE